MKLASSSLKPPGFALGASALLLLCAAILPPVSVQDPVKVSFAVPDCVWLPGPSCAKNPSCTNIPGSFCHDRLVDGELPGSPYTCLDDNGDGCYCCFIP